MCAVTVAVSEEMHQWACQQKQEGHRLQDVVEMACQQEVGAMAPSTQATTATKRRAGRFEEEVGVFMSPCSVNWRPHPLTSIKRPPQWHSPQQLAPAWEDGVAAAEAGIGV